jgi:hypothetical protein
MEHHRPPRSIRGSQVVSNDRRVLEVEVSAREPESTPGAGRELASQPLERSDKASARGRLVPSWDDSNMAKPQEFPCGKAVFFACDRLGKGILHERIDLTP